MTNMWLLMQQRVGSTWLASTHLAQHPQITMLDEGKFEACWGRFDRSKWIENGMEEEAASLNRSAPRWMAAASLERPGPAWLQRRVRELGEANCLRYMRRFVAQCRASGTARVCGWKAPVDFCPTTRCERWLWQHARPTVVRLFRSDVLRQAASYALAANRDVWTKGIQPAARGVAAQGSTRCERRRCAPALRTEWAVRCQWSECGGCKQCVRDLHYRDAHKDVLKALAYFLEQRRIGCRYLGWHRGGARRGVKLVQLRYEDLEGTQPERTIARVYRLLGVDSRWRGDSATYRRQAASNGSAVVRTMLGDAEYAKLLRLMQQGGVQTRPWFEDVSGGWCNVLKELGRSIQRSYHGSSSQWMRCNARASLASPQKCTPQAVTQANYTA